MHYLPWFFLFIAYNIFVSVESSRILGIFVVNSRSHHSINQPILKGLAARGHQVTIISHFNTTSPVQNYTEILLGDKLPSFIDSIAIDKAPELTGLRSYIKAAPQVEIPSCKEVLGLPYVRNLITSKEKHVDLLFSEVYHFQCYLLLAHKLDVPLILVSPPSMIYGVDYFTGNPSNPSVIPLVTSLYTTKMNFFQRLVNLFHYCVLYWYQNFVFNAQMKEIAKDYFQMDLPADEILHRKVALAFYNNHFSFISRPKPPNVIDIAGIHIQPAKALPEDIENFIKESSHGVIFFSFGSTIQASSISADKLDVMKQVFASIPQRIIWRVNELNITNAPPNVKLGKWFPQRDILEHKNVIAFISHCGLFSTLEAIHTATPVIGIPFMFDQFQDAKILAEQEAGIYLDYDAIDKTTFAKAIDEITKNKKYHQNMQRLSTIFKDRPISQLDEAIYWSEYILKFKGAPHLRIQGADMSLFQYLLLDVIAFAIAILIGILYLCKYVLKIIFSLFNKTVIKNKIL